MDKDRRLLAVATLDGVSLWSLKTFEKIDEQKIGNTKNVRFNKNETKLLAATDKESVFEMLLQ